LRSEACSPQYKERKRSRRLGGDQAKRLSRRHLPALSSFTTIWVLISPFCDGGRQLKVAAARVLKKRFIDLSRNSETSKTSNYFVKIFARFFSVSRYSKILNILRNHSKKEKLRLAAK
jgi:hypothetical protein